MIKLRVNKKSWFIIHIVMVMLTGMIYFACQPFSTVTVLEPLGPDNPYDTPPNFVVEFDDGPPASFEATLNGHRVDAFFTITPDKLRIWDINMNHIVEPGEFEIMVGASSCDIKLEDTFRVVE